MTELHDFLQQLRQPEYVHVLLNPIPVYAMASGILALVVALILRSRPAQVTASVVVIFAALSVWPVREFGERASDRVYAMSNREALVVPRFRPRTQLPLALATLVFALASLGVGGWISQAGGKVRHSEFRNGPPPNLVPHEK